MNPIQFSSILALLFGILVLIMPEIINYLVALFFIIIGINGLIFGSRVNRFLR